MFVEQRELENLFRIGGDLIRKKTLTRVHTPSGHELPVCGLVIGSKNKKHPTLGLFAGVHGLEKVGTRAAIACLYHILENMRWDRHAYKRLETCRIVAVPLINPGGMFMHRRSNPNGVDLMRNAPVEAITPPPVLVGGHRWSHHLPYYRGPEGAPMEKESSALVEFVRQEMFSSKAALTLDFHSGFGMKDRLWFPYAKGSGRFPRIREVRNLITLLERTYPNHNYRIEPQAVNFTAHGDLWDYIFDLHMEETGPTGPPFIPWTLEMGSWRWIRKNPSQIFSSLGPFNPMVPHRLRRVMRRHLVLVDLLLRAVHNFRTWASR